VKYALAGHHHDNNAPNDWLRKVTTPDIELLLPARAENIAVVRHALGALGDAFAIDGQTLADIRLAVTEACTNVVVHAYPADVEGPLEMDASVQWPSLVVVVRDRGGGISPRASSPGLGLGLPLIASLADSVELRRGGGDGTAVRMVFDLGEADGSGGNGASP